ncbi:DUF1176 domain-containing protein [Afifella pfennigii]|uniref:DUF1176 domain-containing protein n=1 Tax=Afifella pfennigii TaxID=209897 RepID=UPI00047D3EAB|nr:DUF1176 domain-containing protein [Afifella pfennigii]
MRPASHRRARGLSGGCALLALSLLAAPATAQETATFKDWSARCAADDGCRAETKGTSTGLGIDRAADEDGYFIRFDFSDPLPDPQRPLTLLVDGEKIVLAANRGWVLTGEAGRSFVTGDAGLRQKALQAMLQGDQLIVEYIDVTGEPRRQLFSLSGLSASLLWIEDRMGLVGRERVAIAPQGLPESGAGAAETIKQASIEASGLPEAILHRHMTGSDCEAPDTELMREIPIEVAQVSETAIVYAIPCTVGAYNVSYRLYLRETGEIGGARTLYFPEWSRTFGWSGTDLLFNISLEGPRLSAFAKGRGLGDCGTQADFTFIDYHYRLDRYAAEEACEGRQPQDWPVIFRYAD